MALYDTIPQQVFDAVNAGVVPKDVYGISILFYLNRCPLYSRLPHLPVGSASFLCTNDNYRPRSVALTAALSDTSGTTVTIGDTSPFTPGDVVDIDNETFLITAIASSTTLTVATRGYANTVAATHSNGALMYLTGNTRTGAEINVNAVSRVPNPTEQYCQVIQQAYSVAGGLQALTNYTSGLGSPLDRDRTLAMQSCMDDFEGSAYYGRGVALTSGGRPQMKGLRTMIATNNTSSPTNYAAYKQSDFVRDTFQACLNAGGNPTAFLMSPDFMSGLTTWGAPLVRLQAEANALGISPDRYSVPFLPGCTLIPAPLLRPGTVIALSGAEVRVRLNRTLYEKPRGSRGDAIEGDMIMQGAIELDNEAHHAFVTGITGFAAG